MEKILIATTNQNKVKEYRAMLKDSYIEFLTLNDFSEVSPEVEETGQTFMENAKQKAEAYFKLYNIPVLADDSGLIIKALGGAPGIHSARYYVDHDEVANRDRILEDLSHIKNGERSAKFHTTIYGVNRKSTIMSIGNTKGYITHSIHGPSSLGYDSIFRPQGYEETFSELGLEEKNKLSSRAKALENIQRLIKYWL